MQYIFSLSVKIFLKINSSKYAFERKHNKMALLPRRIGELAVSEGPRYQLLQVGIALKSARR